jgi:Ca-activated chloride channel family protein
MFQNNVTFANPDFLYLLLIVPVLIFWYIWRHGRRTSEYRYSTLAPFKHIRKTWRERSRHVPFSIRMVVLCVLVIALARPQSVSSDEEITTEGIDIVLLLDVSGSMLAEDFKPNRIGAAKSVAASFVDGRISDRIGLVVFAGESFTQCPLTMDYRVLKELLNGVKSGLLEDGTAIGMAIANGVNRLKDSQAESKVMILLTDGINNRGEIDPLTATQIAQNYGIKIYTVGVGTMGTAPYPVQTPFGTRYQNVPVEVDEETLKKVAAMTGGRFYRATDNRKLEAIYAEIDELEKTEMEVRVYRKYAELFYGWIGLALFLVVLEFGLSNTLFRKIP